MLVREPAQRADAQELLKHPFLKKASDPQVLSALTRNSNTLENNNNKTQH